MGYILNRFDKLMELKNNESVNEQFKLTAIIVHDPRDKNLKDHIRSHFLEFAELTGKNFLFITFIQPPEKYADALRRGKFEHAKLLVCDSNPFSEIDTFINPMLRDYYGLPQDGSYLVLAKKLSDNEAYRVSTTTGSLPYQLMHLTSYCNHPHDFDGLIRNLRGESINIKEILGESLLKLVSLISSRPDDCPPFASYAQQETAKKTINEKKVKLLAALKRSSEDEELTDKVLSLYGVIEYVYLNVLNQNRLYSNYVFECLNYRLLDVESRRFWNTYSRLSRFMHHAICDELDYSAFILYLAKIVETELNHSVCQMLRQSMGIAMPEFYNRYCYNANISSIPTARLDVPLNKYKINEDGIRTLEGVPLGNLLHAYMTAVGIEIRYDDWGVPNPECLRPLQNDFLPLWEAFVTRRNDAAHSRTVDVNAFRITKNLFSEFLQCYLSDLYRIKVELRTGNGEI